MIGAPPVLPFCFGADQQTEGVGPLCSHTHTHTLPPPLQPGLEPPFLEEEPWKQQTEALRQGAT